MSLWPAGYISMVDPVHILMLEWCGGGAGAFLRSLAPQHGGYKDVDADDIYTPLAIATHAIHVYLRMRGTVLWWAGWSIFPFY